MKFPSLGDSAAKIERAIRSCVDPQQVMVCHEMIDRFHFIYGYDYKYKPIAEQLRSDLFFSATEKWYTLMKEKCQTHGSE